ncbi:MAG TPA: type II toxin-antitoxin system VapC family toxin [Thermoanaerobaculia bacterium]|nr:type II toxin-antitoxin system VapC family toxin [Thermoanaerobaculia bacterium]
MRLLLDTHVFLWYVGGDQRVRGSFRDAIENADTVYLSVVSVWEATIKYYLGKLPLPEPPHPWLSAQREQHGIESLPIDESSVAHLPKLESHHRDPFDRILVCQAIEHGLQIATADPMLARYPAKILPLA